MYTKNKRLTLYIKYLYINDVYFFDFIIMNNLSSIKTINLWEKYLSWEIKESIANHCYVNSIEIAIKNMKENEILESETSIFGYNKLDDDWKSEVLIFNYVSQYLKNRFEYIFDDKTDDEKINIIYEAIEEFLRERKRENQISRVLSNLKRINQEKNPGIKKERKMVLNKLLALFV